MNVHFLWFLVVSLTGVATCAASVVADRSTVAPTGRRWWLTRLVVGLVAMVAMCVLGLLWRVHAIASVDSDLVRTLSRDRRPALQAAFGILTTLGDAIPSLLIATGIAGILFLRTRHAVVWVLPLLVILQEAIGVTFVNVIAPLTMQTLEGPPIVIGNAGSMPSGSVARLFAIFTIAAQLWTPLDVRMRARYLAASVVLVPLQGVTRIYLGLHLVADIVGGLLLGLGLVMLGSLVIDLAVGRWPLRERTTSGTRASAPEGLAGP